ncbi:MAG: hypothetical protein IPO29_12715 [Anaerolineae bacterium]|nr:hypothetical protein [Anaerolineae bacterium]
MDDDDFASLAASSDPLAHFIVKIVGFYQAFHRDWYKMEHGAIHTHDSCAILYLLDPTLFSGERWPITVPHDGPAKGATLVDRRGHISAERPPVPTCLRQGRCARRLDRGSNGIALLRGSWAGV